MPLDSQAAISVRRLSPHVGAEVSGIDLAAVPGEAEARQIGRLLAEHGVLVFRDQDITAQQQIDFGRCFGELLVHPFKRDHSGPPELMIMDVGGDRPPLQTDIWHADETYRQAPPMGTILRAKILPPLGGDTLFVNMAQAYQGLSERMKAYVAGLEAEHDLGFFRDLLPRDAEGRRKLRQLEDLFPTPVHPVVALHPVTRVPVLYVNRQFTTRILGLKELESRAILDFLFRQADTPEYQLRLTWRPNTVAFWDNRLVQHYAPHDYLPERRYMERVTIAGDRPIAAPMDSGPRPT